MTKVTEVLSTYAKLMEYVAPDHSSRDWYETSGQLVAAWSHADHGRVDALADDQHDQAVAAGSRRAHLPRHGELVRHVRGRLCGSAMTSRMWMPACAGPTPMSTPQVQNAFSALKESISPYTDTPRNS